jgi:hypothetical protein
MGDVRDADSTTEPEWEADPDFEVKFRTQRDEIHRHIGAVVRNAAEMEDTTTALIAQRIDRDNPGRVRPLI